MEKTLEAITINNKMPLKHKMAIFMASITHTIENGDIMDFAKNIVDTRDERIKFIESIIKVLKAT
jgi:hypothetical protein